MTAVADAAFAHLVLGLQFTTGVVHIEGQTSRDILFVNRKQLKKGVKQPIKTGDEISIITKQQTYSFVRSYFSPMYYYGLTMTHQTSTQPNNNRPSRKCARHRSCRRRPAWAGFPLCLRCRCWPAAVTRTCRVWRRRTV
jgi:hypothetical protein